MVRVSQPAIDAGGVGLLAAASVRPIGVRRRRRAPQPPSASAPISNARIAIVMLLVAETMFFAGLIGAYLVFRVGSPTWPPPDLPRLPLAVTTVNTVVLTASVVTMAGALAAAGRGEGRRLRRLLGVTGALGSLFLLIQGSEWVRLIHHGLTLSAGTYGATFYVLVGAHALHVLAAVLWVGGVTWLVRRGTFSAARQVAVEVCAIYWFFVWALWLALFVLVYR
jgi:cytochrome c oxidase subunit 3